MQKIEKELNIASLYEACSMKDLNIFISKEIQNILLIYLQLLMKWNVKMNLVGPKNWYDVLTSLLVDSAWLAKFFDRLPFQERSEFWDLGAGAGLPGIPLRMIWKKGYYTLVEVREKRSLFLKTVLATCNLSNTTSFMGRVENFMPLRPKADGIVSRAFMPWEKVLTLVSPYIASSGICVFLTRKPAPNFFGINWKLIDQEHYVVGKDSRYFWALQQK